MRSVATTTSATEMVTAEVKQHQSIPEVRSAWHSTVPYLFGGLAAMLGLIAFALLILACSYWRLTEAGRSSDNHENERDLERGNEKEGGSCSEKKVYEEKFLVIMAGNEKPTFIATPVFTSPSSSSSSSSSSFKSDHNMEKIGEEEADQTRTRETHQPEQTH